MTPRRLAVVTAGLSQPSSTRLLADRLAAAAARALDSQGLDTRIDVVELRDHAHDIMNNLLTGFPSGRLRGATDTVAAAAGLVAVTPIFTASYSGLFKSFFDVLEPGSLAGKPVLIAATGGSERHSLALEHAMRPLFTYLRAMVVPTGVYAASADWGNTGGNGTALASRIDRAAGELANLMGTGGAASPADPFTEPTPFAQLLAEHTKDAGGER